MMRRALGIPFFLSATVTAAVSLWVLIAVDGRPLAAAPAARSRTAQAPYLDSRRDVAHPGSVAARATAAALQWLQRHQYAEGMWSARSFTQMCEGKVCLGRGGDEYDVGVTALAALAILESGQARPKYEESVRRALAWLASRQDETGCFGPRMGKYMYGHAISTLAFARAYPLMGEAIYKHHAARGVRFLEMARNPGLAWRYGVRDGESDTSVTAWAGAALLASASPEVEITVDRYALDGIRRWLAEVTGDRSHEASYLRRGAGGAAVRGFDRNEGLTASALWLRLRMGQDRRAPEVSEAAKRLVWNLPIWNEEGSSVDYAAWFSGTRALAAYGDAELWGVWSARALRALVPHQRRFNEGCLSGSWDPVDKWGGEGGRVYATSMNLLTLGILDKMQNPDVSKTAK